MNLGLQETVALVVDSHLAIATAAAASLANEGAILSLTAPDNYHMRHVEIELARLNIPQERFRAVIADLNRTRDIHRLVRETLHRQNDIGVLVTTVQDLPSTSAVQLDEENIRPALERNFLSSVQLTREVLPHMKRLGQGRIINLVPLSAIETSTGNTLSSLSLAPLLAYFKGLSSELAADNITVNNIIYAGVKVPDDEVTRHDHDNPHQHDADGLAEHERLETQREKLQADSPMHRMAEPSEIGDIVTMIASSRASYMTGANIFLDGGMHHHYYA